MKKILLSLLIAGLIMPPITLGAQKAGFSGRWVNAELRKDVGYPIPVLNIQPDGKAFRLLPKPQFDAIYRIEEGRLLLTMTAGPLGPPKGENATLSLTLQGDKLVQDDGKPFLTRFLDAPKGKDIGYGTWKAIPPSGYEEYVEYWTFRSDGQLIFEVGFQGEATITGDTMSSKFGSFKLRRDGESLYLENDKRSERLVKRPWGCFGIPEIDATASECR